MRKGGQIGSLKRSRTPSSKAKDAAEETAQKIVKKYLRETTEIEEAAKVILDYRKPPISSSFFQQNPNFDPNDSLKPILEGIYGKDIVREYLNNNGKRRRAARKIVELSAATTQCINTIGNEGKDTCWLCGGKTNETINVLKPVCEHVLPIAQAVFFLRLYSSREEDNNTYKVIVKLEYGWAHAHCNSVKSDRLFIKENKGLYEIDWASVDKYLSDLQKRCNEKINFINSINKQVSEEPEETEDTEDTEDLESISGNEAFKKISLSDIEGLNLILEQLNNLENVRNIIKSKLDPVIEYINSHAAEEKDLLLLARVSNFDSSYLSDVFQELLKKQYERQQQGQGKTRKHSFKKKRRVTKRIKMF